MTTRKPMCSDEINRRILEFDNEMGTPVFDAFGGKPIPYLGWFWRKVNFDYEGYYFAVMPVLDTPYEKTDKPFMAFMESNKWGYNTIYCGPEDWAEVKKLIIIALESMTTKDFEAANDKIQSLGVMKQEETK